MITAGTAIRESMELLSHSNAQVVGVVVALDREETAGSGNENDSEKPLSAVQVIHVLVFDNSSSDSKLNFSIKSRLLQ